VVTQFYGLRNRMPIAFSITFQLQTALLCISAVPATYDLPRKLGKRKRSESA